MQMQKIKKVASGALGLFLTGATLMGPALAAADLSDFQNMGPSDTLVVVGASAITADVVGGINIGGKLAQSGIESATCSVSCADSGTSQVTDGVKIETKTKSLRFNAASQYSSFADVKASLSSKDLDLLQKETVTYTDGTTTSYTQLLTLSTAAKVHFTEDDSDGDKVTTPRVVLNQPSTGALYTYKITAASGLDTRDPDATTSAGPGLSGEDMNIMGKTFTVGVQTDISHNKLVLYGGGEEKTLVAGGDSISFELDGETHTIQMTSWTGAATTLKGVFLLDGVQYEKSENSAITVNPTTNSQITIKKLSETKMPSTAGGAATEGASATIFIGSAKLTLEDSQEVKKGDDAISDTTVTFTNTTNQKITSITITYTPEDRMVADVGESLVDPVFGAFEYVFSGYSESDNDARDTVKVYKSSSTKMKLAFTNNEGDDYDIDLATLRASNDWVLGGSTDTTPELHVVQAPTNVTKNDYFFLSDGENSYVMKYTSIDTTDKEITIKNVATDEEIPIVYDASGDGTFQVGAQTYTVEHANAGSLKQFDIVDADAGSNGVGGDTVMYTRYGHKFNVTSAPSVVLSEYDDQSDTDLAVLNVTVTTTTAGTEVETIDMANGAGALRNGALGTFASVEDSKIDNAMTVYGSFIVDDTDADDVRAYMPDDQVTYDVYVMKAGVSPPATSTTGTTVSQTVEVEAPSLGNGIAKLDSVTTAADKEAKNLILVGGPAANKLVEELATAGKTPDMAYWMSDLQGKYILQAVEDAFATGKTAIVVAGWEAADTQAASLKLATEDVSGAAVSCLGTSCSEFTYAPATEEEPATEEDTTEEEPVVE